MAKYGSLRGQTAVLDTELNALANAIYSAISDENYDNTTNLDFWADAELAVTFGSAPTAGNTVDLYLLDSQDGSTFPDGGGAVAPAGNLLVGSFILRAVTTAQKCHIRGIPLSPGKMVFVAYNGSGVAFPASGSTIKINPYQTQ